MSFPSPYLFFFCYKIQIKNLSDVTATLIMGHFFVANLNHFYPVDRARSSALKSYG